MFESIWIKGSVCRCDREALAGYVCKCGGEELLMAINFVGRNELKYNPSVR